MVIFFRNELLIVKGNKEVPVRASGVEPIEKQICSWRVVDDVFGLTLCTNFTFPNTSLLLESPLILFSGPIKFALTLEKSDPSTKKYIFEYKMLELVVSILFYAKAILYVNCLLYTSRCV